MAADLTPLKTELTDAKTTMDGAAVLIGTFPKLLADAAQQSIANGATAEQLKPVTDLGDLVKASSDALAKAVAANTPTPTPTPAQLAKAKGQ